MSIVTEMINNKDILDRQNLCIAQGALTNSKRPESFVKGVYPTHLMKARDSIVWDINGRSYIDFICGLGTNILGYANPKINQAMFVAANEGASLSLNSVLEIECAERLKTMFHFIEKVKFLKTGSDACAAAIKIARSYTNRDKVLTEGYHGWADPFVSIEFPASGVHKNQGVEKFTGFDQLTTDVAAVIIEPVNLDHSSSRIEFLKELKVRCELMGIVLIFDEIITGLRFPKYGACNYTSVKPDLVVMAKALGNGMPITFVGGKKDLMDNPAYFVSGTFFGERLSLAAACRVLEMLRDEPIDFTWEMGEQFISRFNALSEIIKIKGYPTRGVFEAEDYTKALFFQECCKAGILFGPSWFFNRHHIIKMDTVLSTCKDVIAQINTRTVKLEGQLPLKPFAAQQRENHGELTGKTSLLPDEATTHHQPQDGA